jgi:hypothetical protein
VARDVCIVLTPRADRTSVTQPLRIGRWDDEQDRYVFEGLAGEDPEIVRMVSPDQISWAVDVQPQSAFDWTALRRELATRGRPALGEADHVLSVGARDESDAQALIAELRSVDVV